MSTERDGVDNLDGVGHRRLSGAAVRLSIFVGENDRWHHKSVHHEIVKRAREAGLAGATVLHGIEGYGTTSLIHTVRLLSLSEDLPIVVVIVDEAGRVRGFLPELDELVAEGTVLLDEVEVIRYVGSGQRAPHPPVSS